jgi:hypothetical protein
MQITGNLNKELSLIKPTLSPTQLHNLSCRAEKWHFPPTNNTYLTPAMFLTKHTKLQKK